MIELQHTTFIIPIKIEHTSRYENAQITLQYLFTTTAGSVTRKMQCDVSAGTGTIRGTAGQVYMFSIEDMGPA